jgi:hypothetical protein
MGSFVALLVNWYNTGLLSPIRQFFLIPKRINEFVNLITLKKLREGIFRQIDRKRRIHRQPKGRYHKPLLSPPK